MHYSRKLILKTLILFPAFLSCLSSYSQYILNPSLEGIEGEEYPPDNWEVSDSYSDPGIMYSYTTNNGSKTYYPVDSLMFDIFRARGVYNTQNQHETRTREYLYQKLPTQLEKNTCFKFSAWICTNPDYSVNDSQDPNVAFPLKFQAWGSNRHTGRDVLFIDSDPISNTEWQEFSFYFSTPDSSLSYLLIEVQWDTINIRSEPYNGMILIDHLQLEKIGEIDTLNKYTLYYHGDFQDTLTAPEGLTYKWSPADYVSNPDSQTVVVGSFNDRLSVLVKPEDGCPYYNVYYFVLDCDTLYPYDTNRIVNHYYRYEEDIILEASEGISYDWEPKVNLSAYNVRAPHLTAYYPHYTVEVDSKYDCIFTESFYIIWSCDTLYPGGIIIALDTLLLPETSVTLTPRYGVQDGIWQPPDYLSCVECQNPLASPPYSITYSVPLTDEYDCGHTELFIIKMDLKVPNTITPNDDGINDCLKVYGLPEGSSFRVYDQAGRLIYFKDPYDPDDCWAGVDRQGKPLQADNYWCVFEHPSMGILSTGFIFIAR
jgi:gliding motility-associated-like protein